MRGGGKLRSLPRKQVKGALSPGRDEEFLPMSEIVLGKQKSACLDKSNTDA